MVGQSRSRFLRLSRLTNVGLISRWRLKDLRPTRYSCYLTDYGGSVSSLRVLWNGWADLQGVAQVFSRKQGTLRFLLTRRKNHETGDLFFRFNFMGLPNCSAPCPNMYLNQDELRTVRYLVCVEAAVCVIVTSFALLTFAIDTKR